MTKLFYEHECPVCGVVVDWEQYSVVVDGGPETKALHVCKSCGGAFTDLDKADEAAVRIQDRLTYKIEEAIQKALAGYVLEHRSED